MGPGRLIGDMQAQAGAQPDLALPLHPGRHAAPPRRRRFERLAETRMRASISLDTRWQGRFSMSTVRVVPLSSSCSRDDGGMRVKSGIPRRTMVAPKNDWAQGRAGPSRARWRRCPPPTGWTAAARSGSRCRACIAPERGCRRVGSGPRDPHPPAREAQAQDLARRALQAAERSGVTPSQTTSATWVGGDERGHGSASFRMFSVRNTEPHSALEAGDGRLNRKATPRHAIRAHSSPHNQPKRVRVGSRHL
jgi:hypothetical protein